MDEIFRRRSIRKYLNTPVTERQLHQLLRAGMAAPSSTNDQEWVFVVIQDPALRDKIISFDSYAKALSTAPVAILICADKRRVSEPGEWFWIQDLSAAAQNMLIEATHMGLGSLWMGLYPEQCDLLKQLLQLPETVDPLMLLAFGVPSEEKEPIDRYLDESVIFT